MGKLACAAAMVVASSFSTAAYADGGLFFLIDGDTFTQPYSITNTSTAGEFVVGFGINLTGTGLVFDPVDFGPPGNNTAGTPFTPQGGTDAITGLIGPVAVADGSLFLNLTFNDFDVGETFSWLIDVDPADPNASPTVFGNQMIGAAVYADFSNGLRGSGFMVAVDGNPDAAQFVITTITPTPGIPEPAAWALMIAGFGLIGTAARHRRSMSVSA
jgi:hypothetical protein